MAKTRTKFVCEQCGAESPKWMGRCPECSAWNTLVEITEAPPGPRADYTTGNSPVLLSDVPVAGTGPHQGADRRTRSRPRGRHSAGIAGAGWWRPWYREIHAAPADVQCAVRRAGDQSFTSRVRSLSSRQS